MNSTEEMLLKISTDLAQMREEMKSYYGMTLDHDHFINGNGEPGAKVEIDRLKQVVHVGKWAGGIIGGVVLTAVTGGTLALAVWWIRTSGH